MSTYTVAARRPGRALVLHSAGHGEQRLHPEHRILAQAVTKLTNADYRVLSLGITTGRDCAFNGAVDALQVNGTVYDEPGDVIAR